MLRVAEVPTPLPTVHFPTTVRSGSRIRILLQNTPSAELTITLASSYEALLGDLRIVPVVL